MKNEIVDCMEVKKETARILLIDDDASIHKLISLQLKKAKYEFDGCIDSRTAIEKIKSFKPNLILMDLMMPNIDGIALSKEIRSTFTEHYIPIIMLTARDSTESIKDALAVGIDDYITKPFNFQELNARVKNMLRLSELQESLLQKTEELNASNAEVQSLNTELVSKNRELHKRVYDLHNIFEISYKVMGQLELEVLISDSLLHIIGTFTAKSAVVFLNSTDSPKNLKAVETKGYGSDVFSNFDLKVTTELKTYLLSKRKTVTYDELIKEFPKLKNTLEPYEIELLSPLHRNDELIGLLCLSSNFRNMPYSQMQLEMLSILTNMLTVAIQNARLYENIRAMSYTDGMTGLHNYRFFKLRLKEELARAKRHQTKISLLILDVDYFKNYNDTLGHPAGDQVLRNVSQILQDSVRDIDIVSRYGGEEFAIILSGADSDGAMIIAERIRNKVHDAPFEGEEVQPIGKLTISIGLATFPFDATTETELIQNADKALYQAKHQGRNRVVKF